MICRWDCPWKAQRSCGIEFLHSILILKAMTTARLEKLSPALRRELERKAQKNHRSVSGEIIHRLERSLEADIQEEKIGLHLRRALESEQSPMKPDDVLAWAEETFDHLERTPGKK